MTDLQDDQEQNGEQTGEPTGGLQRTINRRRMFLAGGGIAGAAALTKAGTAAAAEGDPVQVGEVNETDDGATIITNTNSTANSPGTGGQEP